MPTKKCSKCKKTKELCAFSKNCCTPDGLQRYCKSCKAALAKAYYPVHKTRNPAYFERQNKRRCCRVSARMHTDVALVLKVRVNSARCRARQANRPCNLTAAYLQQLYDTCPRCALSKLPFDLTKTYATISLDRVDPAGDYVQGNVRLVRTQVNIALNEWGLAPLVEMANALAQQFSSQDESLIASPYAACAKSSNHSASA